MKIAIIKEEKSPPDSRVPLNPTQVKSLIDKGYDIEVMRSPARCFRDHEYEALNIPMIDKISDHKILLGVKEVPVENVLEDKTYFIFSHTIKEQPYNKKLIQKFLAKKASLIDYEVLTDDRGARVIAFGKFAGMVGAHNAIYTYAKRTKTFDLPRMKNIEDYAAAKEIYKTLKIPNVRIVLTGSGRVSGGAAMVLNDMGIKKVTPYNYLLHKYDHPVYTQIGSLHYVERKDGETVENVSDFYENPQNYQSSFGPFAEQSDIMINGIYWNPEAPAFFTAEEMKADSFKIKVIADVTCDIAPEASIPSTIRATTIADPILGYDPIKGTEVEPHQQEVIDVMSIDNLPNELPRDASTAFGEMFIEHVIPHFNNMNDSVLIRGARIVHAGELGEAFTHLHDYAYGK